MNLILRFTLAISFLLAGAIKLTDIQSFAESIESIKLLNHTLVAIISNTIPVFEVLLGFTLLNNKKEMTGPFLSSILCLSFTIWISVGLITGNIGSCGCFGKWDPLANYPLLSLVRAIMLFGISVILIRLALKENQHK